MMLILFHSAGRIIQAIHQAINQSMSEFTRVSSSHIVLFYISLPARS